MPYKLSNDTRNNVISLVKTGKSTKDIVQATGVSRAQVIRMKISMIPIASNLVVEESALYPILQSKSYNLKSEKVSYCLQKTFKDIYGHLVTDYSTHLQHNSWDPLTSILSSRKKNLLLEKLTKKSVCNGPKNIVTGL